MTSEVTKIHPLCPKCGKQLHIELPGYDALKAENARLRQQIARLTKPTGGNDIDWFMKALRGEL